MKKYIIVLLAFLFAVPVFAYSPSATVRPPSKPTDSSAVSAPAGGSVSYFPHIEEVVWDKVVDLSRVKLTPTGMIKVEANYSVNPKFISYWGYQLALRLGR